MTSALIRERQREIGDTDAQREEGHGKMKAEIGSHKTLGERHGTDCS